MYNNKKDYYDDNQYSGGDTAFDNSDVMVTTYRTPTWGALGSSKTNFNRFFASPRVITEHVNGIVKGRFPILQSIPLQLSENPKSMMNILLLIDVCVILHNFLTENNLNTDDAYFYKEFRPSESLFLREFHQAPPILDEMDELNQPIDPNAAKDTRREQLRAYLSESGYI